MSSILTNTGAMVALQTMRGINKNMAQTQSEISTGKSISNARDNAAIWSIAKTMESDVSGFKAIGDSLGLAKSTVSVARVAAETTVDLMTEMKNILVAGTGENVDHAKLASDLEVLQNQITSVLEAAQFNGLNLANGDEDVEFIGGCDRRQQALLQQAAQHPPFGIAFCNRTEIRPRAMRSGRVRLGWNGPDMTAGVIDPVPMTGLSDRL